MELYNPGPDGANGDLWNADPREDLADDAIQPWGR
jgi:hypothetical protein